MCIFISSYEPYPIPLESNHVSIHPNPYSWRRFILFPHILINHLTFDHRFSRLHDHPHFTTLTSSLPPFFTAHRHYSRLIVPSHCLRSSVLISNLRILQSLQVKRPLATALSFSSQVIIADEIRIDDFKKRPQVEGAERVGCRELPAKCYRLGRGNQGSGRSGSGKWLGYGTGTDAEMRVRSWESRFIRVGEVFTISVGQTLVPCILSWEETCGLWRGWQ